MVTTLLVIITLICFFFSSAFSHSSGSACEESGNDTGFVFSVFFFFAINCFGGLCAIGIVYANH